MKKYGALIALGLAILFGVSAVWLANRMMTKKAPEVAAEVKETLPVTKIVIAARDIETGTLLTDQFLTLAEWPKANVPKGAFYEVAELNGRVAVTKLHAGSPLLKAELADPGSGAGLVALIPQGTRAMSIRVDEVIGVAGFILPNSYVDVVHVDTDNVKKIDVSDIILEKVKVLAIAQETYTDEEGGKAKIVRTVTLELTPKEATLLALKTRKGSIHLLLRNPLEEKRGAAVDPSPAVKAAYRPKAVPTLESRVTHPPATPHTVEVIRGSNREDIKFKNVESEDILNK
jgi:pilus assembly protein CpaB